MALFKMLNTNSHHKLNGELLYVVQKSPIELVHGAAVI